METGLGKGNRERRGVNKRIVKNEKGEKEAYDTSKNASTVVKTVFPISAYYPPI